MIENELLCAILIVTQNHITMPVMNSRAFRNRYSSTNDKKEVCKLKEDYIMEFKLTNSSVYNAFTVLLLIYNFSTTQNSTAVYHPKNISKLWDRSHFSKHMNTDVLQVPSSSSYPNSGNRVRKSIVKNPKVNFYASGDSHNEEDDFYEEDTSDIKISKTIESPQPELQLQQSFPASKQSRGPLPDESEQGNANLRSKAKDSRNIEINVALPRLPPPQYIPVNVPRTDVETYDNLEIPKSNYKTIICCFELKAAICWTVTNKEGYHFYSSGSAVVSPDSGQLDLRSLKAVADEVADGILHDVDRLYESLLNGNLTNFPDTNHITCNDHSLYIIC